MLSSLVLYIALVIGLCVVMLGLSWVLGERTIRVPDRGLEPPPVVVDVRDLNASQEGPLGVVHKPCRHISAAQYG